MVLHNSVVDPYTPAGGYYECERCGFRETSSKRLTSCPDCGAELRNIAVARE